MGKPNEQWRDDPEGKPESTVSKAVRQTAKLASQVTKLVVKQSGVVDEETAEIVGGVADAVQNQAEAGRDASIADRLKMAGWYIGVRVSFWKEGGRICISPTRKPVVPTFHHYANNVCSKCIITHVYAVIQFSKTILSFSCIKNLLKIIFRQFPGNFITIFINQSCPP